MIHFLLASESPRRRELLRLAGYPFLVQAVVVDEESVDHADPAENSRQTARLKAHALQAEQRAAGEERPIIIAADTIVTLDNVTLGKPANRSEARRMLQALRGRTHQVHTGMALIDLQNGQEISTMHIATVTMRPYRDAEIERYIAGGDPLDKAGAYGIQHHEFRPVAALKGCYLGVMGLSICQLLHALQAWEIPPRADLIALQEAHRRMPCPLLAQFIGSR